MNNNTNSSTRYQRPDTDRTPFQRIGGILRSLDFRSWVVLLLMFAVLTAMMGLNAFAWTTFMPVWIAYLLSGFMEAGALGWKVADERKENSDAQQQLTTILTWLNVILAVLLLVANLIRTALHSAGVIVEITDITGWDYFAFILVALSALSHVAGALLFRQWDERIANRRIIAKQHNKAAFDRDFNDGVLTDLEARLQERQLVLEKLDELRAKYAHLPTNELNALLREAKNALEEKFQMDVDDDGFFGTTPMPQMALDVKDTVSPDGQRPTRPS